LSFTDASRIVDGMRSRTVVTDASLVLVAVLWGSTYLTTKRLVDDGGGVLGMLSVRMLATALALGVLVAVRRRRIDAGVVKRGSLFGVILAGVFVCETFGVARTSATNAGVLISLTVLLTPFVEAAVLRRAPRAGTVMCAAAALVGIALLSGGVDRLGTGDLLMLLAAVIRSLHVTAVHRFGGGQSSDPVALTFVQLTACAIVLTACDLLAGGSPAAYLRALDGADIALMAYLVVACTLASFFIQMRALARISASRVSLLLGTEPVWAVLIGVTLGSEAMTTMGWVGIVVVLGAVGCAQFLAREGGARRRRASTRALTSAESDQPPAPQPAASA